MYKRQENKDYFENNLQTYLKSLDEATEYIQAKINEIPEESRYLITAHDAFGYFAEQFGLQVKAIQGVSTDSEIGAKQIEDLANFIVEHNIKAIFCLLYTSLHLVKIKELFLGNQEQLE